MQDKLTGITDPLLLVLSVYACLFVWHELQGVRPVQCVIERTVTRQDVDGNPQHIKVEIIGQGRY